jgi:ribosomal-protein-serine acetyltransferase
VAVMETTRARLEPILIDLPAELVGERVLVRSYQPGDGQAVWEAIQESRERLTPWFPWIEKHQGPADSEAFARRSAGRWLLREDLIAGIWERETGFFLGSTGLHPHGWDIPAFEIGYWLRTSAEGRGCASEAVRLLLTLAFETFEAERVYIRCDTRNERSAAVARRVGMVQEGLFRCDNRDPTGALRDTLYFSMTAGEYASAGG